MKLADRLDAPDGTQALLFDLDGVLLDTLTMEFDLLGELLAARGIEAEITRELVRSVFPYPIPEAWTRLLRAIGRVPEPSLVAELAEELERERAERPMPPHPGAIELLRGAGVPVAVVSNNPAAHVEEMLADAGVRDAVNAVVGNDGEGVLSKPAPDPYLAGARAVGADPGRCTAIEDSLIGAESARAAGCHVAGVATGAATFDELSASPDVDVAYTRFEPPVVRLTPGDVRDKTLDTPNEFVSHMLEHVAWRLGCSVEIHWQSDDWRALGVAVGEAMRPLLDGPGSAQALGMIDDGSAEVRLTRSDAPGAELSGAGIDLDWFTSLRVEQLRDGDALVQMLDGLTTGAGVRAQIEVTSLEDPHHTWEAIWRGLGVALRGLSTRLGEQPATEQPTDPKPAGGIEILSADDEHASVRRTTAESVCEVTLRFGSDDFGFQIETSDSVNSAGLADLVARFAERAGLGASVDFKATRLSSSHVAAEDVGMTIGVALKALAGERMRSAGIEGAGSSLNGQHRPIRVGVSFEGRKFVRFVPVGWGYDELRHTLIGQTLSNGLFSEDLDDFVDGFAGGMGCSVVIHWERLTDPDDAWAQVFDGLGAAIRQLLAPNAARRGVIAGVKGTLA